MREFEWILLVSLLVIVVVFIFVIPPLSIDVPEETACTADAKICPDGTAVGRDPDNNCEFFPCENEVYCLPEQRNVEACTFDYTPVCGYFDPEKIQCVTYPCAQTYSNSCGACGNEDVLYWIAGECPPPGG